MCPIRPRSPAQGPIDHIVDISGRETPLDSHTFWNAESEEGAIGSGLGGARPPDDEA